ARCSDEFLVDHDVVEVAEPILQMFERRDELPSSLRCPLALKQLTEEFRGIAELFHLNAQLVAVPRIQLGQCLSLLADLALTSCQLRVGKTLDRHIAATAHKVALWFCPVSGLQPGCDPQNE